MDVMGRTVEKITLISFPFFNWMPKEQIGLISLKFNVRVSKHRILLNIVDFSLATYVNALHQTVFLQIMIFT